MTDTDQAAPALTPRPRRLPGEEGIWILVCGDLMIFSLLFGTFLVTRGADRSLFAASQALLDKDLATLNTCILLISSWCMAAAVRLIRSRNTSAGNRMIYATVLCGMAFAVVKVVEYRSKLDVGINAGTNEFFMLYYVITGLHLGHLLVGAAVLLWIARRNRRSAWSAGSVRLTEVGATFWHFVDIVWVVIFPLIYLANQN